MSCGMSKFGCNEAKKVGVLFYLTLACLLLVVLSYVYYTNV